MNTTKAWRFLPFSVHDGAMNMAIDEAILEAHADGAVPPTLRLYGFRPSAITIGLNQKMDDEALQRINARGIDVVRRPTGGRAVLHHEDITYSFVGTAMSAPSNMQGFLSDGVGESYKQICAGLIEAFSLLGLQTDLGSSGVAYRHLQDCFMATTGSDLQHRGTKLVGSAQVRRRGVVLQHGSAPLNQEPGLMAELLGEPQIGQRHINLFEAAGRRIEIAEFELAFAKGFAKAFGATVEPAELTTAELERANELREKHAAKCDGVLAVSANQKS